MMMTIIIIIIIIIIIPKFSRYLKKFLLTTPAEMTEGYIYTL